MKSWIYKGLDKGGGTVKGLVWAERVEDARQQVSALGLKPVEVKDIAEVTLEDWTIKCQVYGLLSFVPLVGLWAAWRAAVCFRVIFAGTTRRQRLLRILAVKGLIAAVTGSMISTFLTGWLLTR
jgi:hypothetical protein